MFDRNLNKTEKIKVRGKAKLWHLTLIALPQNDKERKILIIINNRIFDMKENKKKAVRELSEARATY